MSNSFSLSFSQDADQRDSFHGGVISSPLPNHQPSRSPSVAAPSRFVPDQPSLDPIEFMNLPDPILEWLNSLSADEEWKIWVEQPNPRPFKIQTVACLSTLQNLKDAVVLPTFVHDPRSHGFFAVQTQKAAANAPRKYGVLSISMIHRELILGSKQFVNELFLPFVPIKPVFDIDMSKDIIGELDDQKKCQFLLQLISHLSRKLDYPSEPSAYSVLECFHENKYSWHIVGNFKQHYASNRHQKAHMLQAGVDFQRYFIDAHIYNTNAQLRCFGSGKWDDKPYSPMILMGKRHYTATMNDLRDSLAQCVPADSSLIQIDLPEVRRYVNADRDIEAVMSWLRITYDQEDFTASAKSVTDSIIKFDVDELDTGCGHRGVTIYADARPNRKTMRIQCKQYCSEICCGYTEKSDKYQKQLFMLDFFRDNGLDKISTPIYDSPNPDLRGFGFFETSPEEVCQKLGVPMPDPWEYFYYDPKRGSLIDPEFFSFIRSSQPGLFNPDDVYYKPTLERLCSYMQLFALHIQATDNWYVRTKTGIIRQKKATVVNEFFGGCCYEIIRTTGRGDDKVEKLVEKPFFPFLEKKGNIVMAGLTMGPLNLASETKVSLTPAKRVDVKKAWAKFNRAPKATRDCLRALWNSWISMAVAYETPDIQVQLRDFLEDWFTSVMFDSFSPTQIAVVLMSAGGGQGKSSMGNFICSFLGSQLSTSGQNANAFFNSTANNFNNFIWLDEFKANKDTADRLKESITAKVVSLRSLYEMPLQESNYRNHLLATNKELVMGVNARGTERRFCVCKFLDIAQLDPDLFVYDCSDPSCKRATDQFGDILPCRMHSYDGHAGFVHRFHSLITNKEDPKKDDLVNGPYFEEFVGMFYEMWLEKKDGRKGTIQSRLVQTRATEECQVKVETQAGKFIEACNLNGFHLSPAVSPDREKTVWIVPSNLDNLMRTPNPPADFKPGTYMDIVRFEQKMNLTPVWERFVCKDTLYTFFCSWCFTAGATKIPATIFFEQLEEICRSRLGYSIIDSARRVKCEKMIYNREGGELRPSFKNSNDVAHEAVLIDMSPGPWLKPVHPQLSRSATAIVLDELREPTQPLGMSAIIDRRPLQLSSTRHLVADEEERVERQEFIEQRRARLALEKALEREEARDGFEEDGHFFRAAVAQMEEQHEDDEVMDRRAAAEDNRARKRFKQAARAGLEIEGIEDNNEEDSCLMDDVENSD